MRRRTVQVSERAARAGAWCVALRANELRAIAAGHADPVAASELLAYARELEHSAEELREAILRAEVTGRKK